MEIQLSEQECKLIIALCDMALRQDGLSAVATVVPLANRVGQLLAASPPKVEPVTEKG